MPSIHTSTESRALALLGQGLGAEVVASAVGVSPSRISQLISDPEFAAQVAELRFKNLSAHSERDAKYDSLEDELLDKMRNLLPMMYKPGEVLNALTRINMAKRRGQSAPDQLTAQQTIVQLIMPTQVINQFAPDSLRLNIHNQVIQAGQQELITVQSSQLDSMAERNSNVPLPITIANPGPPSSGSEISAPGA